MPQNFNYFSESEQGLLKKIQNLRTKIFGPFVRLYIKLGITANMVSYFGLFLLIGFIYCVVSAQWWAVFFLFLHFALDGLDGVIAREEKRGNLNHEENLSHKDNLSNQGNSSNEGNLNLKESLSSGSFVDMVCDHTGMVIVTISLLSVGFLNKTLGAIYIYVYTVLIIFAIIRNLRKIPMKFFFRTKYYLYLLYLIFVLTGFNGFNWGVAIFIILMLPSLFSSYFVLKKDLRNFKK